MGTKVTLVEYEKNIAPIEDKDIFKELSKILKKSGINILNSSKVVDSKIVGDKVEVTIESNNKIYCKWRCCFKRSSIKSNIENIGLEEIGIEVENDKIKLMNFILQILKIFTQ